jgi:uncharacterized membrane protein YdbT with pleckstrin-like domain
MPSPLRGNTPGGVVGRDDRRGRRPDGLSVGRAGGTIRTVPFPDRLLNEGEELVLDLRPHWWFFAKPAALLVVVLAGLVTAAAFSAPDWVVVAAGVAAILALLWLLGRYAKWATTNFVVTSDRLILRSGVLAKRGIEIPLERVNTVFFNQSILERMLRLGDLLIESGGEQGTQRVTDIPRPSRVQNEIHRQIEANQRRELAPSAPAPESVPDQLDKLDALRQRGVITQAEFDAKKAQLLERM